MTDTFYTITKSAAHELKIKGSRFLGFAQKVSDPDAARSVIETIRRKYHDASHNCTAFRIGISPYSMFRYSDDGEPSGTAGKPIMDAIDGRILTNTLCIITRYFGGVKLGTGSLARAYAECAAATLDQAGRIENHIFDKLKISFNYALTGIIMTRLTQFKAKIIETVYSDNTALYVEIRQSRTADLKTDLVNAAAGRITIVQECKDC